MNKAANSRHGVHVEREDSVTISGDARLVLGHTRFWGLYFHDDEVATCWAVETFERSPDGGTQKGYTVNRYKDSSTTIMSFEAANSGSRTRTATASIEAGPLSPKRAPL